MVLVLAGVAEAAAAVVAVETLDHVPRDGLDALDNQLGDSFAAFDVHVVARVGVQQDDLDLAAVGSVDQPRRVGHGQPAAQRIAAPWQDEAGKPHGDGDGDPRRDQLATAAMAHYDVDRRA